MNKVVIALVVVGAVFLTGCPSLCLVNCGETKNIYVQPGSPEAK